MNLKRQAISAGRWTTLSAVARLFLQLLQLMILARLLMPADFGFMAAVGAVLAVATLLADFGVNRLIMHRQDLTPEVLRSLFWFNLLCAVVLALLLSAFSPLLAMAYGEPALKWVFLWCALIFPLSALGAQFRTLAARDFRFESLAYNEVASGVVGLVVGVMLALAEYGVYALVGSSLVAAAMSSLLAWWRLSAGHRPGWRPTLTGVREHLSFGGYVVGESMAGALHREAELIVAGLVSGPATIGIFAVPRSLCLQLSNTVINPVITRVGIPIMAKVQGDLQKLRTAYLSASRMTAAINFPLYLLLGFFADDVVAVLYGPRWQDAAPFLQLFAAWALLRSTGNPVGSLIIAGGHARLGFIWNVALCLLVPLLLWVGAHTAGLRGLAWTMLMLQAAIFFLAWRFLVWPMCEARFVEYAVPLITIFLIALTAVLVSKLIATHLAAGGFRLGAGAFSMAIVYMTLSWLFQREWFVVMLELTGLTRYLPGRRL